MTTGGEAAPTPCTVLSHVPRSAATAAFSAHHHRSVMREFAWVVAHVRHWDASTPVPGWAAVDVVEHLVTWLPAALPVWAGLSLVIPEPAHPRARFTFLARQVQALLDDTDRAQLLVKAGSWRGATVSEAIHGEFTPDVFIHTWDLAASAGVSPVMDRSYATQVLRRLQTRVPNPPPGVQNPTTRAGEPPDPVDRLIRFAGRDGTAWPVASLDRTW